jgi:hypothetical protein
MNEQGHGIAGWQISTPQTILDGYMRVIADSLGFCKSNPARLDWIIVRINGLMELEQDMRDGLLEYTDVADDPA